MLSIKYIFKGIIRYQIIDTMADNTSIFSELKMDEAEKKCNKLNNYENAPMYEIFIDKNRKYWVCYKENVHSYFYKEKDTILYLKMTAEEAKSSFDAYEEAKEVLNILESKHKYSKNGEILTIVNREEKKMGRLRTLWYNTKHGVRNLIRWFPIIWKDRNWDYGYLYIILRKKLVLMEDLHRNEGHCVNNVKYADQMKMCIVLLDALIEDMYCEEVYKAHDEKWKNSLFSQRVTAYIGNTCRIASMVPEEKKDFNMCIMLEETLRENDKHKLFELIRNNIDNWWD